MRMGYSRNKRDKRRNETGGIDYVTTRQINVSEEKQKARVLRKSPWWRKKISSGICYYCGRKFHPDELTMDHKIPLTRGGTSEKINLVPACKECNNKKKYLLPTEWQEYMDSLKE